VTVRAFLDLELSSYVVSLKMTKLKEVTPSKSYKVKQVNLSLIMSPIIYSIIIMGRFGVDSICPTLPSSSTRRSELFAPECGRLTDPRSTRQHRWCSTVLWNWVEWK
jgi:hypothetical protein